MAYRIPVYAVQLVRERSQSTEVRTIRGPANAYEILAGYLQPETLDREHFCILLLDTKNNVRGIHTVSIGTLNSSLIHPREVFKPAIPASANAVVLAHNHPSGDPEPSAGDWAVTRRLEQAGKLLGIEVLDHLVIGDGRFVSLRDLGWVS